MNEIETHIEKLFSNIPQSRRKNETMQEIILNLNEKVSDLILAGQSRESAVKKAIEDFGDIGDLREELESGAKLEKAGREGLSLAFSVWGFVLIVALMLFINLYYTPAVIWYVYPAFGVIWWPMTLFFRWLRHKKNVRIGLAYSVCGFALITALMLFINFYYTPGIIWFVYPVFGTVWWPLAMLFRALRKSMEGGHDSND